MTERAKCGWSRNISIRQKLAETAVATNAIHVFPAVK
jgi:hypothetical protein